MPKMLILVLTGVFALAACGQPESQGTTTPTTTTTSTVDRTTTTQSTEETTTVPTSPARQPIDSDAAIADLARRLKASESNIEVVKIREVTWPNGAMGCPEEGMSYTQALIDGSQIVLRHDGRVYIYNAGSNGAPFFCPSDDKDGGYEFVPPPGFND